MGFITKIKNMLGIGGVSVKLQAPNQVSKSDALIKGVVTLSTKSEQEVLTLKIKFIEEYSTGRGDDEKTKEIKLGSLSIPCNLTIKPGEIKEIPFSLPFEVSNSNADDLIAKGGGMGALGKMAKFANKEKSEYFLEAEADVKSASLDPSDKKEIKLI